jgi:hypothetical protein
LIVKCSHCKQILSSEDFDVHECDLSLKECKRIEVVYFQDESYKDKKLMSGWGIDGTIYTFEVVPRKPIPMLVPLADEKKQQHKTDEEGTDPAKKMFNRFSS